MEKLQAALEKARANRTTSAPPSRSPRGAVRSQAGHTARLWAELRELQLSDKDLSDHLVVTRRASEKAAPFDILRTKILLQMQQNGWKRLAITSPMPRSGKTTIACNLALGLGRHSNLRAMLFDMDLASPSVARFLGHETDTEISSMLLGDVSFEEQAGRIGENVCVSMSRGGTADPTSVLLSGKTEATLNDIQTRYDPDVMIFDMPSILMGDNTRAFLKNVDCALIVARANNTQYGHFDMCEREIAEHTNVLGVILNAFRTKDVQSYTD